MTMSSLKRDLKYTVMAYLSPLLYIGYLSKTLSVSGAKRVLELYSNPIIIGGCPRSGTTLLLSILSCHPKLYAIGDETGALCPRSSLAPHGSKFTIRKDKIIKYMIDEALDTDAERWCEKTPRNVLAYETLIHHFGKNTKVLNIVRDGRDVVTSRHPSNRNTYYVSVEKWIHTIEAGLTVSDNPRVFTLRYEDLVLDYEDELRRVCEFLELDFVDDFLNYPESARIKGTAEKDAWNRQRTAVHNASIGRYKHPEHCDVIHRFMATPRAVDLLEYYRYSP